MNHKTDRFSKINEFKTFFNSQVSSILYLGLIFIIVSIVIGIDFQISWTRVKTDGNDEITVKAGLVEKKLFGNLVPVEQEIPVSTSSDDDTTAEYDDEIMGPYPVQTTQPPHSPVER